MTGMRNIRRMVCLWLLAAVGATASAQNWIADFRQATAAEKRGTYAEAAELYTRVIDTTPDTTALTDCLNSRANCYKRLAAYARALEDYDRAIGLVDAELFKDRIRCNKAGLLLQMGQYDQAKALLDGIAFDEPEFERERITHLASAYAYTGQLDEATGLLTGLIASATGRGRALLLQNRGFIRHEQGRYEEAFGDIREALSELQGAGYYIALANLAVTEAALGRFDEALNHIDATIAWQAAEPSIGTAHPDYIISLRKRAEILLKAGDKRAAAEQFKQFYRAELTYIGRTFATMTEQNRLDFWYKEKSLLSSIFSLGDECPDFLYDVALLRRHIALTGARTALDPEALHKALAVNAATVAAALKPRSAAIEFVCYRDFGSLDTTYLALVMTPRKIACTRLGTKSEIHGYPVEGVRLDEAVCAGTAFVNDIYTDSILAGKVWQPIFDLLPEETDCIGFAPDGLFQMLGIEHLPYPKLAGIAVQRLSSTAQFVNDTRELAAGAPMLVAGGISYNDAPKQAAADSDSNHAAYDYVLQLNGAPLVFDLLPGAESEAEDIAALLHTEKRSTAYEADLKRDLGRFDLVHLATHGYSLKVSLDEPPAFMRDSTRQDNSLLACGIALTGANRAGREQASEDGLLSAREICDMDLSNVQFITLSACQTAQGVVSDEGPAGIVRGLKRAGAHSVIATLWSVHDEATALFMNAFYRAWLVERLDRYTAFAKARDSLRSYTVAGSRSRFSTRKMKRVKTPDEIIAYQPYEAPVFWAPFILID